MAGYVDGFVIPVPKENLETYRQFAEQAALVWKECGAISYVEAVADDVSEGEITSFPRSVQLKEDEVAVFAWITYESRKHRDQVNEAAMKDPRIANFDPATLPFDAKRMIWGGFKYLVHH